MVNTVNHGVDEVVSSVLLSGSVVLHQMKTGLFVLFIVTMQFNPLVVVVGADVVVDSNDIFY